MKWMPDIRMTTESTIFGRKANDKIASVDTCCKVQPCWGGGGALFASLRACTDERSKWGILMERRDMHLLTRCCGVRIHFSMAIPERVTASPVHSALAMYF